jgi:hypothetical protein
MPPPVVFGWLYAIMKVSELDVLRMVGLDAYMLLRYITPFLFQSVKASVTYRAPRTRSRSVSVV